MIRFLALIILLSTSAASACPFCRDAVSSQGPAAGSVFNGSIYFVLGGWLVAGATMVGVLHREIRRRG